MTTYKKLTWDSYKIQVESAVRDGNGATISTTYATKTEVTTGLGTKLDTTTAASTYLTITSASSTYLSKTDAASTYATQTALSNGLAGKADTATTLGGYGITDGVTTNTAQTIDGLKTFSSPTDAYTMIWKSKTVARGDAVTGFTRLNQIQLQDKNGDAVGYIQNYLDGAGNTVTNYGTTSPSGSNRELRVVSGTDGYATVPYRTYNSANINDIVTIGSLASNPSVIHATGNETISGTKTFTGPITERGGSPSVALYCTNISSTSVPDTSVALRMFDNNNTQVGTFEQRFFGTTSSWIRILTYHVGNGTDRAELRVTFEGTTAKLLLVKRLSGTETSTTIATL